MNSLIQAFGIYGVMAIFGSVLISSLHIMKGSSTEMFTVMWGCTGALLLLVSFYFNFGMDNDEESDTALVFSMIFGMSLVTAVIELYYVDGGVATNQDLSGIGAIAFAAIYAFLLHSRNKKAS